MRIGRVLLYYSLAVTILLLLIFVLFISTISFPDWQMPKYFLVLADKEITFVVQNGEMRLPPLSRDNTAVVTNSSLEQYYVNALLKRMPLLAACLIGLLILGTFVLLRLLRRQNEKQAQLLAKQLRGMEDEGAILEQHPAIASAYQDIRGKLEAQALDYVRLSSYVTHEQKNILSLLRAKLQLSDNAELMQEVDKVTHSLDDILTLSSSRESAPTELVDAALVCAGVCDEFRKLYPNLLFDFEDDAVTIIRGRELWIRRAVSNLITNAVKYGSGAVTVTVTNKKGSVMITVMDEGEGIDETEQEKLFDYQYRVGKLKRDGYGIGLSLVRHVCELCGGLCWVENGAKGGTSFSMILPEAEALTID